MIHEFNKDKDKDYYMKQITEYMWQIYYDGNIGYSIIHDRKSDFLMTLIGWARECLGSLPLYVQDAITEEAVYHPNSIRIDRILWSKRS